MAAKTKGWYEQLPQLAVAQGATTPDPGAEGVLAWSTTLDALVVWNGAAWVAVSGGDMEGQPLTNFITPITTNAGTAITLGGGTSGDVLETTSGSAVAVTLSATAAVGFTCNVVQAGAGQVTFAAGGGGALRNREGHTKTAGQWAVAALYVRANPGGSAAEWVLAGDTAA